MSGDDSSEQTRVSLLARVRDPADREAWRRFFEAYLPVVYHLARRKGLQDADASDVAQEVMIRVARAIRGFEYSPERGRFRDWLYRVTSNAVASHHRGDRREARGVGGEDGDANIQLAAAAPDAEWIDEFNQQVLRVALERTRPHFQPATWRAFELAYFDRRPAAEVARETGLSIGAVHVAKSRVSKRLRDEVMALADDHPLTSPPG
jgi:RNA polymerase sigma-70 factor (ECF subfamily)